MKKKILSLLLALVMALSLVPTSVLAAPVDLGKGPMSSWKTLPSQNLWMVKLLPGPARWWIPG